MKEFELYFSRNGAVGKRLIWEHTIYQVVRLFDEAQRRVRAKKGRDSYCELEGWWLEKKRPINGQGSYRIPSEVAISEALCTEMEAAKFDFMERFSSSDPDLRDIDTLEFHTEAPRRKKKGIGKKAKPTDFRFYRSGLGDLDLRIEAKVLTKTTDIPKDYLSDKGLGRFSDSIEPYTDDLVGGMIAYTVSEDQGTWRARIRSGFASASPGIPNFDHNISPMAAPLMFSRVPFAFPIARSDVLVFHLVMEFDSEPLARP